ncbi:multicopper oxidase [Macrolepiota fuliginosa MF-IS2]|uniref:Multicopper oxidase n=1 Tax=Macrolepiota fuliginosa MF-IS2 TaxID=1400762 RepID=A0A9P6C1W6_9AGAR|nr:multicopper oxidase [Macrolepiota fuliginosa MF-IS2]
MVWKSYFVPLLFTLITTTCAALGPVSELVLTNKIVSPDGFSRSASLINGQTPGPVIAVNKDDYLRVNVVNELDDPYQLRGASIHWHGILQKGTPQMDGTVGVTQCPISPGNSFEYAFPATDAGTYWYHSHFGMQYCDGVRGVLVVYDPDDPLKLFYDIDNEQTIITLSEWYHTLVSSVRGPAQADSTLINGKGRYPGGPNVDLAIVNVEQGKRYRFRLVSISCDPNFIFSIDSHDLTVIEVEGAAVRPYTINTIQILAGQRYSVVLNAGQPVGNYWIRALPNSGHRHLSSDFTNGVNSAILRYSGAPNTDPVSTQQATQRKLVETELHPMSSPFAPGSPTPDGADYVFNLTFDFDFTTFLFTVNGHSFKPPTVPVLLQIMSGARTAHELLPDGSVFVVERNKTVQVNMPSGLIGGPHPFHLHGHTFSVVRSADSGFFNFLDPVRRDVVNAGDTSGDYVSIRFTTDNPGPWIFHCHIDFHLEDGLAFVFAEAPDAIKPIPPSDRDKLCPNWDSCWVNKYQICLALGVAS